MAVKALYNCKQNLGDMGNGTKTEAKSIIELLFVILMIHLHKMKCR